MLGEPPRTAYDISFSIAGIPVRVHPFFWLVTILLGASVSSAAPEILTWVAVVFVSILIHEFGHAMAMRYYGWHPSVTLYGMGGLASYNPGFTASHSSYRRAGNTPLAQIVISAAGPIAGFLFAGAVIAGLYLSQHTAYLPIIGITVGNGPPIANAGVWLLVQFLLYVNIFWGLINLFPVYPLDGGHIAREILLVVNPNDGVRQSLILSVIAGGGLAIYAMVQWQSLFIGILFGYMAYSSYMMLQSYGGTGGFGGRPW